eukprot:COSAG01_NODE_26928_length_699_cov_1.073333_1_plen_112_part_00
MAAAAADTATVELRFLVSSTNVEVRPTLSTISSHFPGGLGWLAGQLAGAGHGEGAYGCTAHDDRSWVPRAAPGWRLRSDLTADSSLRCVECGGGLWFSFASGWTARQAFRR